ncbi:MAG: glutamine amidotransferase [Planctomycetes bacterium]|nr:glutamine amidotransferase [Planctomycetota bacterium]
MTQRVEDLPDRNERRDCLDQAWARLLVPHGFVPVPLCNAVEDVAAYVDALDLDGFILTGGNDLEVLPGARTAAPERDAFERRLIALARDRDVPLLGVCRGLQMLVVADGGALEPVSGHVRTPHAIHVAAAGAMPLADRDAVNSFHDFGVPADGLGPNWTPVATAPDGSVEAIAHKRARQWAIMWHPERGPADDRDIEIIRRLMGSDSP